MSATGLLEQRDTEMKAFLDGVFGLVEATDFERHMLWADNGGMGTAKLEWVENLSGLLEVVGHLDDMPVCISLMKATVDGKLLLFWHPTSQVVDHRIIDDWMEKNIPQSARRSGGSIHRTDPMNFHNIFRKW